MQLIAIQTHFMSYICQFQSINKKSVNVFSVSSDREVAKPNGFNRAIFFKIHWLPSHFILDNSIQCCTHACVGSQANWANYSSTRNKWHLFFEPVFLSLQHYLTIFEIHIGLIIKNWAHKEQMMMNSIFVRYQICYCAVLCSTFHSDVKVLRWTLSIFMSNIKRM